MFATCARIMRWALKTILRRFVSTPQSYAGGLTTRLLIIILVSPRDDKQAIRELTEYQRAVALGLRNWDLFLNLGLAQFESGDFGRRDREFAAGRAPRCGPSGVTS